jgi:hypothetical protein
MKEKQLLDEVYSSVAQGNLKIYSIWIANIVFSWRWWLAMILSIVPWILWIKIRKRTNTARLLFVGLVVAITSNVLDTIGASYNLWHYDWKVMPFIPIYFPWDFTLFPIFVMILLQFKPKINKYIKSIVFSFMCSFVFEPFFSWISMYHKVHWKYWYSFIIYIPLYLFYDYLYKSKMWQYQNNS